MGGCSMSEKLCYFCREHEIRASSYRKKKNPRCFQVTDRDLGNSPNTHNALQFRARWPHTQHLTEMNCLVLEVVSSSVHRHLSSGRMRTEGSRKGRRGREGDVTEGATCWNIQTWPLDFKLLLPTVACLPFSRHVPRQEGSFPFTSRNGVLSVPSWPQRLLITHSPLCEDDKSGESLKKLSHVQICPSKVSRFITIALLCSRHVQTWGFVARFACNNAKNFVVILFNRRKGQIIIETRCMMFVTIHCLNKTTRKVSGSEKSCISQSFKSKQLSTSNIYNTCD